MKFIHTADWHLGKIVHGVSMLEDQRHILNDFVSLVEREQPDAVIIAGDLYDRSVPPTDAVELLNEILFKINVQLKTPVLAIAGNHDSAERLSFGSSWYEASQFYLAGKLCPKFEPVKINGVNFYLLPYAEPGTVRQLLNDGKINSHESAMEAIVSKITEKMNKDEPNVLVGHAFVVGGKETESERTLSVGGSGAISKAVFSPFTYVALGHLHSPDALNDEKIHYSGSLLKYSFSEVKQRKAVLIVEMSADGNFTMRDYELKPIRDMRELVGNLADLLDPNFYINEKVDDYLKISLLDEGALIDPMNKLRQVYPNVLHLKKERDSNDTEHRQTVKSIENKQKSELEMFEQFYNEMTTVSFDHNKRTLMEQLINKVRQEENLK